MKKRILASLLSLCLIVGLLPAAALAADEGGTDGETPVVCTMDEGCAAKTHDEGCPLYAAPEEPAPCALTEGCTLEAGHEGECALPDEPEAPADPAEDEETGGAAEPTIEEQLAALIAALPAPDEIDPLDEEQAEKVNDQISAIYAFADENGLDVEDNETIHAVIAALYPAEPLAASITSSGGELTAGTYTLAGNVTLSSANLTIPANTDVTIDLSGYTLTGNGDGSVIIVNGTLTIQDSGSNGTITGGKGNTINNEAVGGGIYVASTGKLTLVSGSISGNEAVRGGGVYISEGAEFLMSGGNISKNKATAVSGTGGGGVCVRGDASNGYGTFVMSGGEISENMSAIQGGGVFCAGEMTLSDGVIYENQAPAGGGVMANYIFTMTGGKITENTATGGQENLENNGTFGHALGGGVKTISDFYLYGGEITNNRVIDDESDEYMYDGGGIHANYRSEIHVKGTPVVSGNTNVNSNGTSRADNIFLQYSENQPEVLLHLDDDIGSGAVLPITKDGELDFGWVVMGHGYSFASGTITSENDKTFQQNGSNVYFGQYPVETEGVIGYIKDGESEVPCRNWDEFFLLTGDEGTLYLKEDIALTATVSIPKEANITLAAEGEKTVEITGPSVTNRFFYVPKDSSLTLLGNITLAGNYEDETKSASTVRAFEVNGTLNLGEKDGSGNSIIIKNFSGSNGAAINVVGGTLNMYCGKLTENHTGASGMGGAIQATTAAVLNIYAGEITENSSAAYGGGLCINGSTLNMYGGFISGNASGAVGSGAHLYNKAFLNMYGGSITNNTSNSSNTNQCSLNTSCAMVVDGTIDNVYFAGQNSHVFYTDGGAFENTSAELSSLPTPTKDGMDFAGWYTVKDFSDGPASNVSDKTTYYAKWTYKITFDANGGEGTMTAQEIIEGATSATLTANGFTKTGYTFSGWNTAADGSGTSYADQAIAPTNSTTLYAQWTPNTYTISFNGGTGASGTTASVTATYDQPATLTNNGFTMANKNFAGWDTDAGADEVVYSDGTQVENLTETASGTVTLYAVWTTKTVLDPDVTAQTKTYNGAEQAFTLDGYTISYQQDGETATPKDAGTYDVVISTEETDTTAAYKNTVYGGLVINPAPLTITPNNKNAYVGDALHTLGEDDYTVTGLVGDDTLNTKPTLAYDGTPNMNTADTYAIKASGAEAGGNYTITYVDGTLTVSTRSSGGSSGGGSSSGNTGNVTGSGDNVNVDVSGGSVTAAQMKEAVDRADRGETITIEATSRSSVSLPSSGLQDAADNDNDVPVELKNGEVTLSPEALSAVAEQAGTTVTLTVDPVDTDELNSRQQAAVGDAPVFDLTIKSGGKTITDFDGGLVTVAIPYELPDGQDPAGVVVWFMDDNGNITACETMYDLRTETVIFTTRHFSKYVIGYVEPMAFTDVPADAYYAAAVAWAVENGITSGTGDGTTFSPDISCTRAQMMTFLWRAAGSPAPKTTANPFTDVQADAYYYDAVLWAVENGITTGTGDTTFSPDATVTRAQTVTFMYRTAGSPAVVGSSFSDVAEDAYYADAVAWAVEEGITAGTGSNTFSPDAACTRAQIVTFLYRDAQ